MMKNRIGPRKRCFLLSLATLLACAYVSQSALIGHWPLDELSGSAATDVANGNNGSNTGGGITWQTGVIGGAVALDGASTAGHDFYISSIPQMSGATRLTISCWINSTSVDGYKGIFMSRAVTDSNGSGRNWGLAREGNSSIDGRVTNYAIDSGSGSAPAGEWLHVVLVWDGSARNKRLYINGVANPSSASSASTPSSIVSSGGWYIGLDSSNIGRHFRGAIDDLAVWNDALSATQVATIYQGGLLGLNAPSALAGHPPPARRDYYVSTTGNNTNPGTIDSPLRDIGKAAQLARPGDTVYIRGGIYRETIAAGRSGEAGNPIVYTAYNNEEVVVTTTDEVTGWTLQSGDINLDGAADSDIWRATVDWDAGDNYRYNTLFAKGILRLEAREGADTDPLDLDDWLRIDKGDIDFDGLQSDDLKGWGNDFWNGAKIINHTTDWSLSESVVGDYVSSTGYIEFQDRLGYIISQKQRFGCFIFDTIKALNQPHEWFKAEDSTALYYKAEPGVNPNTILIEFKRRDYTFVLNASDHIHILDMEHRGGGIYVDGSSDYGLFKGNKFHGYGKRDYAQFRVEGTHHCIEGNEFTEVFSEALILKGIRHDVVNNRFYRIGLEPEATVISCNDSRELLVSHNTFSMFTRTAMRYYPYKSVISHNLFEHGCRTTWDTAYIDGDQGGGQGGNSLVHHNVFRDGTHYGSGFAALYSGRDLAVYRNFIYDVGSEPIVNVRPDFMSYFHNTMVGGGAPDWEQDRTAQNSSYRNNIQLSVRDLVIPGVKMEGNHNYLTSDFADYGNRDLSLSSGAGAIDAGVLIPGFNDDYAGAAPDAGALEYGEPMWQVGHDFANPPNIQYDWSPVMGMNIYENGNFMTGATDDIWTTEGSAGYFNGNGWNVAGLSPTGGWSYRVRPGAKAYQTFDNINPNSTYRVMADVRLLNELFDIEDYTGSSGTFTEGDYRSEQFIEGLDAGEWLSFDNIDFGDGMLYDRLELSYSRDNESDPSHAETSALELRLGSPSGTLLGTITYSRGVDEAYGVAQCALSSVSGTQTVYLVPTGPNAGTMQLNSARFYKTNPLPYEKMVLRAEDHGFGDEITFVGKAEWDNDYEGLLIQTGPDTDSIKVVFENQGPYDAYIDRFALYEVAPEGLNAAAYGYAVQSSSLNTHIAANALDGSRSTLAAVTQTEFQPYWLINLRKAYPIDFLRITASPRPSDSLGNLRVSLWREDPRLGGDPAWSNDYLPTSSLTPEQSLIIRAVEKSEDGLTTVDAEPIRFVRIERLDAQPLSLAEVEVHSALTSLSDTDGTVDSSSSYWRTAFHYDMNPTHITVMNGAVSALDAMRLIARNEAGSIIWSKDYTGLQLNPGASFEIPGNEIGSDGTTRLASLLARRIDIEQVSASLALSDVIIHDGNTVLPKGNLALDGIASQSGDHYRNGGRAELANNGLIFPLAEFSSTEDILYPYWQVKLAKGSDIDQIVVFNRVDAAERLGTFRVSVLNAAGGELWGRFYSYNDGDIPAGGSLTVNNNISGTHYVKVQISGTTILSLPEVQVWGEPAALRLDPTVSTHNFDLGTAESPVQSGWTRISPITQGDVWWEGDVNALDRGTLSGVNQINQDFVYGERSAMLNIKLPDGVWTCTFNMGEMGEAHDNMLVWAEGLLRTNGINSDPDNNPPGPVPYLVFHAEVNDGILNLQFADNGGTDPSWATTRLSLVRQGDLPTTPTLAVDRDRTDFNYDFGPEGSVVAPGYEELSPNISGDITWSSAASAADRGAASGDLNRDLVYAGSALTLEHAISNGTWNVALTMGDAGGAHDQMRVIGEGGLMLYPNSVTANAGEFKTVSGLVIVDDGSLSLDFADLGGGNPHWVVNSLEMRKISNATVPADSDTDGLPDIYEQSLYGHPTSGSNGSGDFDDDGQIDKHEIFADTDPVDPQSLLTFTAEGIQADNGSTVTLTWQSVAGRSYTVWSATTLTPADWLPVGTTTATGSETQYPVNCPDDTELFFRIQVNP